MEIALVKWMSPNSVPPLYNVCLTGLVNLKEDTAPRARYYALLYGTQGCAWSRNLDPYFCPGRGLKLRPLTW